MVLCTDDQSRTYGSNSEKLFCISENINLYLLAPVTHFINGLGPFLKYGTIAVTFMPFMLRISRMSAAFMTPTPSLTLVAFVTPHFLLKQTNQV